MTRPEDLTYIVHERPPRLARRTRGLRIVAQVPDDPQPLGIGFNKNNPELLAAVDGALSGMKQDRAHARLTRTWGVA